MKKILAEIPLGPYKISVGLILIEAMLLEETVCTTQCTASSAVFTSLAGNSEEVRIGPGFAVEHMMSHAMATQLFLCASS